MPNLTTRWSAIPREWVEGAKEFARIVLIAVIPVILAGLNQTTGEITINWYVVGVVGVTALIKAADKMIHTVGKDTGNASLKKGLTRF